MSVASSYWQDCHCQAELSLEHLYLCWNTFTEVLNPTLLCSPPPRCWLETNKYPGSTASDRIFSTKTSYSEWTITKQIRMAGSQWKVIVCSWNRTLDRAVVRWLFYICPQPPFLPLEERPWWLNLASYQTQRFLLLRPCWMGFESLFIPFGHYIPFINLTLKTFVSLVRFTVKTSHLVTSPSGRPTKTRGIGGAVAEWSKALL